MNYRHYTFTIPLALSLAFAGFLTARVAVTDYLYTEYLENDIAGVREPEVFEKIVIEEDVIDPVIKEEVVVSTGSLEEVVVTDEVEASEEVEVAKVVEVAEKVVESKPKVEEVVQPVVVETKPEPIPESEVKAVNLSNKQAVVVDVSENTVKTPEPEVAVDYSDYDLGVRYYNAKDYTLALPYFEWQAEYNFKNVDARSKLRLIHREMTSKGKLEDFYLSLIEKYSDRAEYYVSLGTLYMAEFWDMKKAEEYYEKALAIDPQNAAAMYNLDLIRKEFAK